MTVLGTRYRLGSTSYVWPDEILPNVRQLGPLVDDVELVLFEVGDYSNLPSAASVRELNTLAHDHDLSYTVHLPQDLSLGRPSSLKEAAKVIASTLDLDPWAYVLHLDGRVLEPSGDGGGSDGQAKSALTGPSRETLRSWQDAARSILDKLAALVGDAQRLCIENLENYAPEHFLPLLQQVPVSLCVDVGHLWLVGGDPLCFLGDHLARTRVVHLHGIRYRDGQPYDHESLHHLGAEPVIPLLSLLSDAGYEGVLTLEVFGREDFEASRAQVAEIMERIYTNHCVEKVDAKR